MKTSNILLVALIVFITIWFVIFEVLCARAVVDVASGKKPRYGFRSAADEPSRPIDNIPGTPLRSFVELEIITRNNVSVNLIKGNNFSVNLDENLSKSKRIWYVGRKLVMELTGEKGRNSSEASIRVPELEKISCYYLRDLTLEGFDQEALKLSTYDVYSLIVKDCKISSFFLENSEKNQYKFITIDGSNQFDSLGLIITGPGTLVLQCAGLFYNHAELSDSMNIRSDIRILRKLRLQ